MRVSAVCAVLMMCGLTPGLFAQAKPGDDTAPLTAQAVVPGMIIGGVGDGTPGYSGRIEAEVYNIGTVEQTGGVFAGSGFVVYDDAVFMGGYPGGGVPLMLTGMSTGFILPAIFPSPNGDHLWTRVSFYPDHDSTVAATATPYAGTPVVAMIDWGAAWLNGATPGSVRYYAAPIAVPGGVATLTSADVFDGGASDRTAGVKIEIFADGAGTVRATDFQVARRAGFTGWLVGAGDTYGWFSSGNDALTGNVTNNNRSGGGTTGSGGNVRATYMGFAGVADSGCWNCPPNLGTLTDGLTTINGTLPTNGAVWHRFTLAGSATDTAGTQGQYLDFDSLGSGAACALGVYAGDTASTDYGQLMLSNSGGAAGGQAQLSFGIGRRAAVGEGLQYDGRGTRASARGLPAGQYYIAVAPAGSAFSNGFEVTPQGPGGAFNLRWQTNCNGAPAGASVRPDADVDLGEVVGEKSLSAQPLPAIKHVRWVRFSTAHDASAADPARIDLGSTQAASSSLTLFNAFGNVVAQSVSLTAVPAPALVFNTDGSLPAGTYDVAITVGERDLAPSGNGRWHVRGATATDGSVFGLTVLAPACGSADFNGDGDVGTDADIEAFFACLGGNCCAMCPPDADFNGDGDTGTDADIEAFFRVLAGGTC